MPEVPSWMVYTNFALNALIVPLLVVLWRVNSTLTEISTLVKTHNKRLDRLERYIDERRDESAET